MKKNPLFTKLSLSKVFNPFQHLKGANALIWGGIILILTSYFGVIGKLYFLDPISIINASALAKPKTEITVLLLASQNLVCWLMLTLFFILTTKLLQHKKKGIMDCFGAVALARFPTLIITLITCAIRIYNPKFLETNVSKELSVHLSTGALIFSITLMVLMIWQMIAYFYALKTTSDLVGKKLWLGFILSLILSILCSIPLTTLIMS